MTAADIMAWLLTATATLFACLLALNLAFTGRRINRPTTLASCAGDILVCFLIMSGLGPMVGIAYLAIHSNLWPVFIIVSGLALLAAPPLHQILPESLRNKLRGAVLLGILCLCTLFLLLCWPGL